MGISIPVPHVMGDHVELEIDHSNIDSAVKKSNSFWNYF